MVLFGKSNNLDVSVLPSGSLTSPCVVHKDVKAAKCLQHLTNAVYIIKLFGRYMMLNTFYAIVMPLQGDRDHLIKSCLVFGVVAKIKRQGKNLRN